MAAPIAGAVSALSAPGQPVGEKSPDIITPLNVRDPSALVMAPMGSGEPAASAAKPPPIEPPDVKPRWLPHGKGKAKGKNLHNPPGEDWRSQKDYHF